MEKTEKKVAYLMLFLLVIKTALTYSNYIQLPNILNFAIELITYLFVIFVLITIMKIRKRKLLLFIIFSLLTFYTGIVTKSLVIFSSFLILCLSYFLDIDKIIKVIFSGLVLVLIVHFIIYFYEYNFIGNVKMVIDHDEMARVRHYLGFYHPNVSGAYTFWAFAAFTYLNRNKLSKVLLAEIFVFIIYSFNQSRTMICCSIILLILFFIIRIKIFNKLIKFFSKYIILIMTAFILLCVSMYNNQNIIAQKIDNITSGRIYHSTRAINTYGLSILGQVTNEAEDKITMDVTYTALLYKYGIVYILLLWLLTKYIGEKDCVYKQAYVILWAVFAFFELYSLNFIVAFPLLFGNDWIGERKKE